MVKHFTLVASLILTLGLTPLAAQAQEQPVFKDYEDMRAQLDELMKAREIVKVMSRFGGSSSLSPEEVQNLEVRMRELYPYDLKNVDVVKIDQMENGWSQELYAYYNGLSYVFVTVLLHQREDSLVALNIKFNTDFYQLIESF